MYPARFEDTPENLARHLTGKAWVGLKISSDVGKGRQSRRYHGALMWGRHSFEESSERKYVAIFFQETLSLIEERYIRLVLGVRRETWVENRQEGVLASLYLPILDELSSLFW